MDFWKTGEGGAYYSIGLGGTSTGRGANFLGIDDPYKNREEAESLTIRKYVWNEWLATFQTRLQPDLDGQPEFVQITHTRWHPDDLIGRIMETPEFKRGEWLHLNFQALTVKERGVYIRRSHLPADDPRYVPGQVVILLDVLSRMVVTGHAGWAEPISEMLKADHFPGAGAFTGQPLRADPRGWQGQGGFANAEEAFNHEWRGWGV